MSGLSYQEILKILQGVFRDAIEEISDEELKVLQIEAPVESVDDQELKSLVDQIIDAASAVIHDTDEDLLLKFSQLFSFNPWLEVIMVLVHSISAGIEYLYPEFNLEIPDEDSIWSVTNKIGSVFPSEGRFPESGIYEPWIRANMRSGSRFGDWDEVEPHDFDDFFAAIQTLTFLASAVAMSITEKDGDKYEDNLREIISVGFKRSDFQQDSSQ